VKRLDLDRLTLDATLADLPSHDFQVSPEAAGQMVMKAFQTQPHLPGAIVTAADRFLGVVSRTKFFEFLSRPYGWNTYQKAPIGEALETMRKMGSIPDPKHSGERDLYLQHDCAIAAAVELALQRSETQTYEPIVVEGTDGRLRLIDMRVLLLAQVRLATIANSQMKERDDRLRQYNRVLAQLAKYEAIENGDLQGALVAIVEAAARTLNLDRASVWRYDRTGARIHCLDRFEVAANKHTGGFERIVTDFPEYFAALRTSRTLAAADVLADDRTRNLAAAHLQARSIAATLDAPVRLGGRHVGVVNLESRQVRQWTIEEENFAASVAELVASAMESRDRRVMETALRQSEAKFSRAFHSSPDPMTIARLSDGRYIEVNESFLEMSGYTRNEVIGRNSMELGLWATPHEAAQFQDRLVADGEVRNQELVCRTHSGEFRTMLVSAEIIELGEQNCVLSVSSDISDRKRLEEELRRSQQFLNTIVDRIPLAVYAQDATDRFRYAIWNRACETIFGISREEAIGCNVYDLHPSDRADLLYARDTEAAHTRQLVETPQEPFQTRDRGTILLRTLKVPVFDRGGNITHLLCIADDITDRVRAAEALRASEERYRDLVETANCVILRWNTNGEIQFLNDFGREFFGYEEEEIIGRNVVGTIVPETESSGRNLQALIDDICQNPDRYRVNENENISSRGDRVWISWANKPIFDDDGNVAEILSIGIDITDRKRAEEALREQQRYLRLILDNIPQQVFWKDTSLVFLGCNRNWAESAGLSTPEEVVGKTDYDLLPTREVAEEFRQRDLEIIASNIPSLHVVATKQRPGENGETIWLDISKIPIHNDDGNAIGILGVLEDITARKVAEMALERERQKSEELLLNILPKPIAEQLKENHSAIAEQFDRTVILFADIVGFTPLSSRLSATELVVLLNQVFSVFDRLADQHQLEKIKTIGDAYMVVGGLPEPRDNSVEAIANMALDMQQAIRDFDRDTDEEFQIRIGINMGSVVAGVIGIKKFIYDLWGDAVNIASRMESLGEPGKIQVTQPVYEALAGRYHFEERGQIDVKGKGKMTTYWLLGKQASGEYRE